MRHDVVGTAHCRQFIAPTLPETLRGAIAFLTALGEFVGTQIKVNVEYDNESGMWYLTLYFNHWFAYTQGEQHEP